MTTKRTARSWRDVRQKALDEGRITEDGIARARADRVAAVHAYKLRQLREKVVPMKQGELAAAMEISQPAISKLERGDIDHTQIGTLAKYITALGGHLRLVAEFGEAAVEISDETAPRREGNSAVLRALSEIEEDATDPDDPPGDLPKPATKTSPAPRRPARPAKPRRTALMPPTRPVRVAATRSSEPAKRSTPTKIAAKKAAAKKGPAKKTVAKKAPVKKAPVKKATAKTTVAKKTPAKKTAAKKAPAKKMAQSAAAKSTGRRG